MQRRASGLVDLAIVAVPPNSSFTEAASRLDIIQVSGLLEAMTITQTYLEPTQESGRAFFTRGISGSVVMLNLLRFRAVADYSATPELAPAASITGVAAYRLYMDHTLPYLQASGGEILFYGQGGEFLIGPSDERWDAAMLIRQSSVASFLTFASNPDYLSGIGHRLAALEDSRLLPLVAEQA